MSHTLLTPPVTAFQACDPNVRVQILVTERLVAHIAEGVDLHSDLALRDSSLVAKGILAYRRPLAITAPFRRSDGIGSVELSHAPGSRLNVRRPPAPRRVRTELLFGLWSAMAIRRSTRDVSLSLADSTVMPRANVLASLVEGVILSWGWRRRAIAFVSGAVGALALPPFSLFALIAVPLTIAVWLIDGAQDRGSGRPLIASMRAAFGAGWWMGFGYFLAGLWWVGAAFLVEADKFAWALPLGVVALPAVLAFFPAAGFAIARALVVAGTRSHFRPRVRARARRMGARPPVHRLSLERPRHGAGQQSRAGSDRFARRPARAHVPDHRHIRRARDAVAGRRGPAQSCSGGPRRARACAHRRLRRVQARGAGQRQRCRA